MIVSERRDWPVKAMTSDDFELVEIIAPDAQGIDDHALLRKELHVVQPAERGGVLILTSSGEAEIDALDFERQPGDVIFPKRKLKRGPKGLDEGDDQGGGRPQARSGGNVDRRRHGQRNPDPAAIALHDMRIDGTVQHQSLADGQPCVGRRRLLFADVAGAENHPPVVVGEYVGIGETIDRGVQDRPAMLVTIGRQIGAASGET